MGAGLQRWLARIAAKSLKDARCAECGKVFNAFPNGPPDRLDAVVTCPACGRSAPLVQFVKTTSTASDPTPRAPVARPPGTRIEAVQGPDGGMVLQIPASGRWGIFLFFGLFWNAIAWTMFVVLAGSVMRGAERWPVLMFAAIFPMVGIGLAWAALNHRFASGMLYLGPARVRFQKKLFRPGRARDLSTDAIDAVELAVFYTQNYQPVHGIEIRAGSHRIRFGSVLEAEEKRWLCWTIREVLSRWNPRLAPPAEAAGGEGGAGALAENPS